eukprot:m.11842 g.11842  ORF g.11842 m.11842 type:complete len:174 (+) comp4533_c0_seq1:105-626(+)
MGDEEVAGREPCPWRILDDCGGAFAMGAIGGSVWSAIQGYHNSPKHLRVSEMVKAVRHRAPIYGGGFAAWGFLYSTYDCSLMGIRGKDDMWNSVASGFLTGGTLAVRTGPKSMLRNAVVGGAILGVIEGIQLLLVNMFAANYKPQAPQLAPADVPPPPPGPNGATASYASSAY